MATKAQIRNWIKAVEGKALRSIEEKYRVKKSEIEETIRVASGLRPLIEEMKKYNDKTLELEEKIFATYESDCRINYKREYWGSFYSKRISSEDIENKINASCRLNTSELVALEKAFKEERRLVEANYASVNATAWSLTPKKAIKYLEELGFDTSSLEAEEKMEVAIVAVDKRYLFVCGDNK